MAGRKTRGWSATSRSAKERKILLSLFLSLLFVLYALIKIEYLDLLSWNSFIDLEGVKDETDSNI